MWEHRWLPRQLETLPGPPRHGRPRWEHLLHGHLCLGHTEGHQARWIPAGSLGCTAPFARSVFACAVTACASVLCVLLSQLVLCALRAKAECCVAGSMHPVIVVFCVCCRPDCCWERESGKHRQRQRAGRDLVCPPGHNLYTRWSDHPDHSTVSQRRPHQQLHHITSFLISSPNHDPTTPRLTLHCYCLCPVSCHILQPKKATNTCPGQ